MGHAHRARRVAGVMWVAGFGLAGWSLWQLGRLPFLTIDFDDPGAWLERVGTEAAVAAALRLMGLALVAWVGFSSLIYLLARLAGITPHRLDWLSIGPLRKAVDTLLAGSLVVTTLGPGAAMAADENPVPPPPTGEAVDPGYVPVPAGRPDSQSQEVASPPIAADPPGGTADVDITVVVAPGDHLWRLAERHLETLFGRSPTDAETAPYWVEVVERNRTTIRSGNPDLIFPGEVIVLPAFNRGS